LSVENCLRRPEIKKRNRIGDSGKLCRILD